MFLHCSRGPENLTLLKNNNEIVEKKKEKEKVQSLFTIIRSVMLGQTNFFFSWPYQLQHEVFRSHHTPSTSRLQVDPRPHWL